MAQKLRQSMTHQQLHDFASGSEKGKPEHVTRQLPPALKQRAQMVKEAHAHLTKAIPNFSKLPATQRMAATQHHVRTRLKHGY